MTETIIDKYCSAKLDVKMIEEDLQAAKARTAQLEQAVIDWMAENGAQQIRTDIGLVTVAPHVYASAPDPDALAAALAANPDFDSFDGIRKSTFNSNSLSARYRELLNNGAPIPPDILECLNVSTVNKAKFTPAKENQ